MIEIGRERTLTQGVRRASSVFYTVGTVLVLVWLVRGPLAVTQYSETILVAAIGLGFPARALRTSTSRGVIRAVSSFLGNMAIACIMSIIVILFLGWVAQLQADAFPAMISSWVPDLAIATIFLGFASGVAHEASHGAKGLKARGPALLLKQSSVTDMGKTKLSVKSDSIGLRVRRSRRTVGCMVVGDISAVFDTPMGTVNATIPGPVTTFGVPFRGEKASGGQVEELTGKKLSELIEDNPVETSVKEGVAEIEIDMPFVHVRRDPFQETVELGPLSVRRGPGGETVKIGPLSIDADEDSERWEKHGVWGNHDIFSSWWSLKGGRDSGYISSSSDGIRAKWNGSSLDFRQGSMKLKVGSDGFTYSPQELETYTPLHSLRVTKDKLTLNTKRFTLDVSGKRVILRTEDGSKSTDSEDLARDLRTLLAEMAKKQVSDVLEGQPIELDEMLSGTEELLKKYA